MTDLTKITFIYITCRENPQLSWFIESLYQQYITYKNNMGDVVIQLVIVDYNLQYNKLRIDQFKNIINDKFDYIHVMPFPDAGQGPHKQTKENLFAASLARNTGVCYAKHPYVCFIDDLCWLTDNSFQKIVECAKLNVIVAFAYKKIFDLVIENNKLISTGVINADHRLSIYNPDFLTEISGTHLFGYSACPLAEILKINGYDQITDGIGFDDVYFGVRLERAGNKIYYHSGIIFLETEDNCDVGHIFKRIDPLLTKEEYFKILGSYGTIDRWDKDGRFDSSHILLDLLLRPSYYSEGNNYNLSELRNVIMNDPNTDANKLQIGINLNGKLLFRIENFLI